MNKYYLIILIRLFALSNSYSQTGSLGGFVKDAKTNEPLIGVNVVIQDTIGTVTDVDGHFKIMNLKEGTYTVSFHLIGYTTRTISNIPIKEGYYRALDAYLEESLTQLPITVVSAGKFEQKISDVTVSMQVIKPEIIENKNTVSMEFIMDQVPGVSVVDNQPSIRGGSGWSYGAGSRVLVMMDDMPYLAADAGDVKWSSLPIENLSLIHI